MILCGECAQAQGGNPLRSEKGQESGYSAESMASEVNLEDCAFICGYKINDYYLML